MKKYFEKFKRFLGTLFLLWLFLWIADKFGFGFEMEPFFLFKPVFFLGVVWAVGEIWINWDEILRVLKAFWAKQKSEFSIKTKVTQAEIVSLSPKIFAGKTENSLVLTLAVILSFFSFFWQFFKALSRFFLQPSILLASAILGVLADIFVFDFSSDLLFLLLTGLWIWSVGRYKFEGRVSLAGGLIFLAMCPFLLIFKKYSVAEETAVWAYMFLVVGVIQMIIENTKEERQIVNTEK